MFNFLKKNNNQILESQNSSELELDRIKKGYNSSMSYCIAIQDVIYRVRTEIEFLPKEKKDPHALGSIHALAKLLKGEQCKGLIDFELTDKEVLHWKDHFLKWKETVSKKPTDETNELIHLTELNFETILKSSKSSKSDKWKEIANKRYISLTFDTKDKLSQAQNAADEKYPVKLGSALFTYLENKIKDLIDEPISCVQKNTDPVISNSSFFSPKISFEENSYSLIVDEFYIFEEKEQIEDDEIINAYDLESSLKKYIIKNSIKLSEAINFDSESSMFCARSSDWNDIENLLTALKNFYKQKGLVREFLA